MEETRERQTGIMTPTQLEKRLLAVETALREAQPYPDDPGAPA